MPSPLNYAAAVKRAAARSARTGAGAAARPQAGLDLSAPAGLVCGVDEAGRGPLAGPVVAAAVILDPAHPIEGLDDSKALSAKKREKLFEQIREHALAFCIAEASVEEIDTLNILQATMLAMRRAVEGLALTPDLAQIDGNRCPPLAIPAQAIIGGDALVPAISAASILAKVTRDRQLVELHLAHPQYGFDVHAGYGTARHMQALEQHGPCVHHRRSFAPVRQAWARLEATGAMPPAEVNAKPLSQPDGAFEPAALLDTAGRALLAEVAAVVLPVPAVKPDAAAVQQLAQSQPADASGQAAADSVPSPQNPPEAVVKTKQASAKPDDQSAQASLF